MKDEITSQKKTTIQSRKKPFLKTEQMNFNKKTIALIDKIIWLAIFFEYIFIFLLFINETIPLMKYTCVEFSSIKLPWENQIKK